MRISEAERQIPWVCLYDMHWFPSLTADLFEALSLR